MSEAEAKSLIVIELAEEFLERHRKGERPSIKEYLDRRPDLAEYIHEVFPAMAMLENIVLDAESAGAKGSEADGPPSPEPTLKQLGDYLILREVGRGGMGIVYEAEQLSLAAASP
jgi:hypothetical protein